MFDGFPQLGSYQLPDGLEFEDYINSCNYLNIGG